MNKMPDRTVIHVQTEPYGLTSQKTLVPAAEPPQIQLSSPRHEARRGHHSESLSSNESEEYTDSTYKEPVDDRNGSVVGLGGDGDSRKGLTLRN
ncbi:hypothetical protein L198_05821 [Cryptococcus wingfieldii CBS 7118]|uniref:Uncharacterized protein n=1 Tax=Cryptococcus wingfieldii CBS 7118 TaxID=1295528 RepID=A0A1E3IUB8_9TREE|nr:hypothetical protein L198_05821 [Cryptococcus wingfieldii CBS 7118]ODN92148.1 hypothetical protein L198_05821 [Cryptococcus wingfieldii CBS 7118]